MSKLKTNANLFIGVPEFKKSNEFTQEYAQDFKVKEGYNFGILRAANDAAMNNFKVDVSNTAGAISIGSSTLSLSTAIDSLGNRIVKEYITALAIPSQNTYYWVSIEHQLINEEVGTVSISANGTLVGVGTKFTESLRGVPNHSSVIRFSNSLNGEDYHVVRVIDDENAIISGTGFTVEAGIKFSVVGTFTPGITVPTDSKLIFQYDDCLIKFNLETSVNNAPALASGEKGNKFYIARVHFDGTTVTIEDKREDFHWEKGEYKDNHVAITKAGDIVGVESITWEAPNTTQDENLIKIGWGFRSSDFTIDPSTRKITLNAGEGGRYRTSEQFLAGNFTGFRIYRQDGNYDTIVSTAKGAGSQIILTLDVLNPENYPTSEEIVITPQSEEIEIWISGDSSSTNYSQLDKKQVFAISSGLGIVPIKHPTPSAEYKVNIKWRLKNNQHYTPWNTFRTASIGFYNENSFDESGNLKTNPIDRVLVPYTKSDSTGFIPLTPSPRHFSTVLGTVAIGDLLKVNKQDFDTGVTSRVLKAGISESVQVFTGDNKTLAGTTIIALSRDSANEGNSFNIIFDMDSPIDSAGNILRIEDLPINGGVGSGTVLYEFTPADFSYCGLKNRRVSFKAYYDNDTTSWSLTKIEGDSVEIGEIKMISGYTAGVDFDSTTGLGKSNSYLGWALCNGQNGTKNLEDKFIKSLGSSTAIGDTSGGATTQILAKNLPPHKHDSGNIAVTDTAGSGHSHRSFATVSIGSGGSGTKVGEVSDTANHAEGGQWQITENNSGLHQHPASSITGETSNNDAANTMIQEPINNEPQHIVLAFIQRI